MSQQSRAALQPPIEGTERRQRHRQTTILRVGIINDDRATSFCLVRNISPAGVQVELFGKLSSGAEVCLRMGDEHQFAGRVVWVRDQLAGIRFNATLEPEQMLRVTQKRALTSRRSSPRLSTSAPAILRTGGRTYAAQLCDISTSGAKVRTRKVLSLGPSIMLTLPDIPPIKTYVRWIAEDELGLVFETPLPIQIIAHWLDERVAVLA